MCNKYWHSYPSTGPWKYFLQTVTFSKAFRVVWKVVYEGKQGHRIAGRTKWLALPDLDTLNAMLFLSRAPSDEAKGRLRRPTNLMLHIACWSGGYWPLPPWPQRTWRAVQRDRAIQNSSIQPFLSGRYTIYVSLRDIKYTDMKGLSVVQSVVWGKLNISEAPNLNPYYGYPDFLSFHKIIALRQDCYVAIFTFPAPPSQLQAYWEHRLGL